MTQDIYGNPADADWCEKHLGQTVVREGQHATLSGYSLSDGYCWATVELDDGSTSEWRVEDLADVG